MARHKQPTHEDPISRSWADKTPERRGGHEQAVKALEAHRGPGDRLGNLTHGLHLKAQALMPCARCACRDACDRYEEGAACAVEREYVDARRRQLAEALAEDGHDALLQGALITVAVWSEVRLARVLRFLAVTGEFLDTGGADYAEYQPAALQVPRLQDQVRKALAELALTPRSRAALKADPGGGFLAVFRESDRILAKAEAQDAEFEAADEEGAPGEGEAGSWAWEEGEDPYRDGGEPQAEEGDGEEV